jgi:hypothetical protein
MSKALERFGLVAAMVAVVGFSFSGCVVSVDPAPVSVGTSYYNPMYYNGYVVYYDTVGRPIYYVGGSMYYIPSTYVHYHALTGHYATYRGNYHRWYGAQGHRYRTYNRAQPAHRGGAVNRGGGTHRRRR